MWPARTPPWRPGILAFLGSFKNTRSHPIVRNERKLHKAWVGDERHYKQLYNEYGENARFEKERCRICISRFFKQPLFMDHIGRTQNPQGAAAVFYHPLFISVQWQFYKVSADF